MAMEHVVVVAITIAFPPPGSLAMEHVVVEPRLAMRVSVSHCPSASAVTPGSAGVLECPGVLSRFLDMQLFLLACVRILHATIREWEKKAVQSFVPTDRSLRKRPGAIRFAAHK